MNNNDKIKITFDDLEKVNLPASNWGTATNQHRPNPQIESIRQWGSVQGMTPNNYGSDSTGGSIFLKSWFYLSVAGTISAFIAWAICETGFTEGSMAWGNYLMFPLMAAFVSTSLIVSELVSEHSFNKALNRGIIALVTGLLLGYIFVCIGGLVYKFLFRLVINSGGEESASNPILWISRSIGWMLFGISSGLIYGIISQSKKKCLYGIIGGVAGAGIGGLFFDPISLIAHGAGASRCVGLMFYGASTGIAISLVESALKDRWLYVSNGPLAGKQFILYKQITTIGSSQSNDIFLFKDDSILPNHASIEMRGQSAIMTPYSVVYISGQPIQVPRKLNSGENIQIGKYTFSYQEKNTIKKS